MKQPPVNLVAKFQFVCKVKGQNIIIIKIISIQKLPFAGLRGLQSDDKGRKLSF